LFRFYREAIRLPAISGPYNGGHIAGNNPGLFYRGLCPLCPHFILFLDKKNEARKIKTKRLLPALP
jgi:hypothetical protein